MRFDKGKSMNSRSKRQAVTTALIWELCWIAVEMISVGIGLWLLLKLQWITVGNLWLLAFLHVDFVVRYLHYSKVATRPPGPTSSMAMTK